MRVSQDEQNVRVNLDISALAPVFALFLVKGETNESRIKEAKDPIEYSKSIVANTSYSFDNNFHYYNKSEEYKLIVNHLKTKWGLEQIPLESFKKEIHGYSFFNGGHFITLYEGLFQSKIIIQ